MSPLRILYLAHRIPFPPNKGDKIRAFHELRGLSERGHAVHLFAFADRAEDLNPSYRLDLLRMCASVSIVPLHRGWATVRALTHLGRRSPLSVGYFSSNSLRREVRRSLVTAQPQVIVVYSSTMAQYVPRGYSNRTVLDMVDVDSEKWRDYGRRLPPPVSWLYRLEGRRLHAYERTIVDRFASTIVTTDREAALLGIAPESQVGTRVKSVRTGVDSAHFQPDAFSIPAEHLPEPERRFLPDLTGPRFVFTGAMDYYANVDAVVYFVDEVLPRVRARIPTAALIIVGSNPSPSVRRLADRPGVTVTGRVMDVRPYLAAATVCIAPLRIARGVQNKILEAMAMERAVVTTQEAAAGLTAVPGRDLLVAGTADDFAEATINLTLDEQLRQRIGKSARTFVEKEHDWKVTLRTFTDIVESVSAAPRGRS